MLPSPPGAPPPVPGKTLRYLALFSAINFLYLGILIGVSYLNDLILA